MGAHEVNLPQVAADRLEYDCSWDFCEQPATFQLSLEPVTAGANANDDVAATLVGVIPRASRLVGASLVVSANSGGVAAGHASDWVVAIGGTTFISKSNTADLVANTPVDMGTPAKTDCAANSAVTLAITNGANADLNSAVCLVTLTLADQLAFPARGLKVVATDGGTCSVADAARGICAISPGTADNDEIYLCSSVELFKFAAGKSFIAETLIQFSEANTDDANVCFGFMSGVAANSLVDNAGGPQASGDYALLWKVDGGTQWYCGVQSDGTAIPAIDTLGNTQPPGMTPIPVVAGGSSYQRLRVKVICDSATTGVAEFEVDGVNVGTIHFTYASATEMAVVVGAKNGSANRETVNVDYLGARAVR